MQIPDFRQRMGWNGRIKGIGRLSGNCCNNKKPKVGKNRIKNTKGFIEMIERIDPSQNVKKLK